MTPYGLTGPHAERPGTEATAYRSGGEGYLLPGGEIFQHFPDRPPVRGGHFLAGYDAGLTAATGALAALVHQLRSPARQPRWRSGAGEWR